MTQAAASPDYRALLSLDDRGFIVLGAGDGIGAQISHGLAQCSARVFCVDIVEDKARAIAEAVGGHRCAADVTSAAGVAKVLKAALVQLGVIHGVVDVLGVARIKTIAEFADEEFERSGESSVGKKGGSTGRSRGSPA